MMPAAVALVALVAGTAGAMPADASPVARWTATSRLTASEAAHTLAVEDEDELRPIALFEARKHLRSDGRLSMAEHVLRESFRIRLGALIGSEPPASSVPPPVLHWLEWRVTGEHALELRGESAQVARLGGDGDGSLVVFDHRSIHEIWTECDGELCVRRLPSPPRAGEEAYRLVLPHEEASLRCDPLSSAGSGSPGGAELFVWETSTWNRDAPLRRIVCELRGGPATVTLRWELFRDGRIARPPVTAPSSIANNPLEIGRLDENAADRRARVPLHALGLRRSP